MLLSDDLKRSSDGAARSIPSLDLVAMSTFVPSPSTTRNEPSDIVNNKRLAAEGETRGSVDARASPVQAIALKVITRSEAITAKNFSLYFLSVII